jgi:hypothetical protein
MLTLQTLVVYKQEERWKASCPVMALLVLTQQHATLDGTLACGQEERTSNAFSLRADPVLRFLAGWSDDCSCPASADVT